MNMISTDPMIGAVPGRGALRFGQPNSYERNLSEQALRDGVRAALEAVDGVTRVEEEDSKVWTIAGSPDGEEMIKAAAKAVNQLAERVREHTRQLS